MEKIQLLYVLFLCMFAASVFIMGIIFERAQSPEYPHLIFLSIGKDTENIEMTAREILAFSKQNGDGIIVVLFDLGATAEQLLIFDKIIGESLDYIILKEK